MSHFFLNGNFLLEDKASLSVQDRGFLLGDGLFESLRIYQGKTFRGQDHWKRLQESANFLNIPLPYQWEEIRLYIVNLLQLNQINDGYVRITLSRGKRTIGGLNLDHDGKPTFLIEAHPFQAQVTSWTLAVSSTVRSRTSKVTGHKTLNYLENLLALDEVKKQGADEALFCVEDGIVQEGSRSNLFMVKEGVLITPSLNLAVLPGITRKHILKLFNTIGKTQEKEFHWKELLDADEIFMTNSLMEIISVSKLNDQIFNQCEVTESLKKKFAASKKGFLF